MHVQLYRKGADLCSVQYGGRGVVLLSEGLVACVLDHVHYAHQEDQLLFLSRGRVSDHSAV